MARTLDLRRCATRVALLALLIVVPLHIARADRGDSGVAFSAETYLEHIRFLASDELEGRRPGSEGIRRTDEYIAEQFREIGLKPAGEDGSYFQSFELPGRKELHDEDARLEIGGLERTFKVHEDWAPMPFTQPGEAEGPLAFAGYGISAEQHGYDDYADFDPAGKVLLILRYEPKSEDANAAFGGEPASSHAMFSRKARLAARKGARALLIVNPPNRTPDKDELYPWSESGARATYDLPMIHITRQAADAILAQAQMPPLSVLQEELDRGREPLSSDLHGVRVKLSTGVQSKPITARNVIGLLEGREAPEEYIVVGAHHDHVGRTQPFGQANVEPQIHNGADDNASGTSAVIELARAFGHSPRPRRSILFMTFSAEELGLLGSRHFVEHPSVPLEKVRAMINFDMVGRLNNNKFEVWGIPTATEFNDIVLAAAQRVGLEYAAPPSTGDIFGRSDHASFYRKGIPVLFPFTGLHSQYHRPDDDWPLIDGEGAVTVLRMFHDVIRDLAEMKSGPTFVPKSPEPSSQAALAADAGPDAAETVDAQDAPSLPPVRLGILPDFNDSGPGLLVESVVAGGAAVQAGLKDGDRIVRLDKYEVRDMASYVEAARNFKPGDEVEVVVLREGQEHKSKVKFAAP